MRRANSFVISLTNARPIAPLKTLTGHAERIFSVAFSPNEGPLASASQDKTVRLWNLRRANPLPF